MQRVSCVGCGAPVSPTLLEEGGSCTFCGATLLPSKPNPAAGPRAATATVADRDPSPLARALQAWAALVVRAAPLQAGLLAGAAGWAACTDGARLDMSWVLGGAAVAALLWRAGGAVFTPAIYAAVVGVPAALRPVLLPIPTRDGGFFSPTSETALTWTLPGLILTSLGVLLVGAVGGKALRERAMTARPRVLAWGAVLLGAVGGWAWADAMAPRALVEVDAPPTPSPARTPPPVRPLVVSWSGAEGLIDGGGSIKASFYDGGYHISVVDLPEGGEWSIGEQSGRTSAAYTAIEVPVGDALGRRTFDALKQLDPERTLSLKLGDGRTGSTRLPTVDARYGVTQLLQKVENGPVRFGDEAPDPAPRDSLYWSYGSGKFIGNSRTLAEMDLVLLTRRPSDPSGTRVCPGQGEGAPPYTLRVLPTEATVYDRRTGEIVAQKVFPGEDRCPRFAMPAPSGEADSLQPAERIEAWARPLVGR